MKEAVLERYGAPRLVVEILEARKAEVRGRQHCPLERVADALEHMGNGRPQGKIVVTV